MSKCLAPVHSPERTGLLLLLALGAQLRYKPLLFVHLSFLILSFPLPLLPAELSHRECSSGVVTVQEGEVE